MTAAGVKRSAVGAGDHEICTGGVHTVMTSENGMLAAMAAPGRLEPVDGGRVPS
jgi:hypothetical protein